MAQMVTADGRLVNVPDGLEGYFLGLSPPPPIVVPSLPAMTPPPSAPPVLPSGGDPQFDPADVTALQSLTPPPAMPIDAPVTSPAQVTQPLPEAAAVMPVPPQHVAGPVSTPAEVEPTPGPSNMPKPLTDKSLMAQGDAGPMNVTLAAMDEQKAAAVRLGAAQAAQATAVGNIETTANDLADKHLAKMQADAEANAKAVNDATALYLQNATKLANTRIDHGVDHPIMAAIGVAMNILGTAMNRQPMGDVMKPVYEAVDRKVAAQMQDIELGKANLALQRTGIDILRQSGNDKMQLQNTLMMAGLEQAKRRMQEVKDKTTSPIIAAQTQAAMADIDARKGELMARTQASIQQRQDAAAARAQTMQIHRETMAVTMRGQNIQQAENDANRLERAQEHIDTIAKDLMMQGKASASERAKMLKDNGIFDPVTGDYLLTSIGQKKMADADAMEAQIRKDPTSVAKAYIAMVSDKNQAAQLAEAIKDPAIATKVAQQYADDIRNDAIVNNSAIARGAIKPEKIAESLGTAQEVTLALDAAKKMLEQDPSTIDRKTWADIKAKLMVGNAKYVKTLGERVSVKAIEAFDGVFNIDPDSWTSRTIDKGKAIEAIESLKRSAAEDADATLKNAGIKTTWKPGMPSTDVTADFAGKTAQELAADATPGSFGSTGAVEPFLPKNIRSDKAFDAANARPGSLYGLAPDVVRNVTDMAKRSETAGHAAYGAIVNSLARPLASADRPGLDIGVAKLLRDTNLPLFNDVMAKVANDAGKMRADELSKQIASPFRPISIPVR